MLKIWEEHGRWKIECRYSPTGDTWIGFCRQCQVSVCALAGKSKKEIFAMTRGNA